MHKHFVHAFFFFTLSASLMAQNVGIQTTTPTAKLHILEPLIQNVQFYADFENQDIAPLQVGGDASWTPLTTYPYEGTWAACSGAIGDNQTSYMFTDVTVPPGKVAYVTFALALQTEKNGDYFRLYDNLNLITEQSGNAPYHLKEFVLDSGQHEVRWSYEKNDSIAAPGDLVWVDSISIYFYDNYALRVEDGSQGQGYVMTSDAYGNAKWEKNASSEIIDTDGDTWVSVEKTPDDDKVRFGAWGGEIARFELNPNAHGRLHFSNYLYNTLIGFDAGQNNSGFGNTMLGYNVGYSNTTGEYNTMVGQHSGNSNTSGSHNVFMGSLAGYSNTEGSQNILIGSLAGFSNSLGSKNVVIGNSAGQSMDQGGCNVMLGFAAGFKNTRGDSNTFVGVTAGYNNLGGARNVAVGSRAGYMNTVGNENVFVGGRAGYFNTSGDHNTFIGKSAGQNTTTTNWNTFVGSHAGQSNTGQSNTFIGQSAGLNNTTASDNTFVGQSAGLSNTTAAGNTFIGQSAGFSNTTAGENTFVGNLAGYTTSTGYKNTSLGFESAYSNTTGYHNVFIGTRAGKENTTGYDNVAIGHISNIVGSDNSNCIFIGSYANAYNSGSWSNSVIVGGGGWFDGNDQVRLGNTLTQSIGGYAPWTDLSDRRVKRAIKQNVPGLEFITRLEPVTYTVDYQYVEQQLSKGMQLDEDGNPITGPLHDRMSTDGEKKSSVRQSGLIAQDVDALIREMGLDLNTIDAPQHPDGFYGIRYSTLIPPLIQAIQELSAENEELKTTLLTFTDRLEALETALQQDMSYQDQKEH